jgi:hypothetical protein
MPPIVPKKSTTLNAVLEYSFSFNETERHNIKIYDVFLGLIHFEILDSSKVKN